jgi:hypothetical protein
MFLEASLAGKPKSKYLKILLEMIGNFQEDFLEIYQYCPVNFILKS